MKTLLLNSSYEILAFISFKSLAKLIVKDKVEILSHWKDQSINWISGSIKYPSIVRMKYYVRRNKIHLKFNRTGIFKRDLHRCQYCGNKFPISKLSIDHIIPRSQGGSTSWRNCVSACFSCNNKKGDRTPDKANMQLLQPVTEPTNYIAIEYILAKPKHPDWKIYFDGIVEYVEPKDH